MKEVLITLLVGVLIFFVFRDSTYIKAEPTIIFDTVYKVDTTLVYKKGNSIPFVVLDSLYLIDTLHDTIRIIQEYLTTKAYSDTINIDSSRFIIQDTISRNLLIGRSFNAQISQKTIFVTKTIQIQPKNELYLGIIGDLRAFDNKIGLGVGLAFKPAKKGLFTLSATTNQYSGGYYLKF